jgi:peroxiredoxin
MALKIGDEAPDFELRSHRGGTVRLSEFKGKKNVVVAFHPLAFTPVCATQMQDYQAGLPAMDSSDTAVLGLRVDPQPSKAAWGKTLGVVDFDLLSDFNPQGEVARKYGVFREADGISERAVFLVGKDGRIAWAKQYAIPEQPPMDDLLRAIDSLRTAR